MSTQRGNVNKLKAPKHKNKTAFKNDLHDTSRKIQTINSLEHYGICNRCKDKIDWKIKYKKYKLLTTPKKCVKCLNKKVLTAYYIVCRDCCKEYDICSKCSKPCQELEFGESKQEALRKEEEFQRELKMLPERQRRKFLRLLEKGLLTKENLEEKIDAYNKDENNNEDDSDFDESDGEEEDEGEEGEGPKEGEEESDEDKEEEEEDEEADSDDEYANEYEDELNAEEV